MKGTARDRSRRKKGESWGRSRAWYSKLHMTRAWRKTQNMICADDTHATQDAEHMMSLPGSCGPLIVEMKGTEEDRCRGEEAESSGRSRAWYSKLHMTRAWRKTQNMICADDTHATQDAEHMMSLPGSCGPLIVEMKGTEEDRCRRQEAES